MTFAALRTILVLHALGVLMQATLAGRFLSGEDGAVKIHEVTGWVIAGLCLIQIVLAVVIKSVPLWFVVASVAIFLGEGLQVGTGYGRFLNVHIPLSILITAAVIWQILWAFGKRVRK
ncbi:MAG TPA: hypothetical protein VG273_11620 [Bryobacteraceae bacterium]|nr:hypothetical protein [Bryobacteraceae bacterium]